MGCHYPGDLPDLETEPVSAALADGFFTTEPSDKPQGNMDLGTKTDSHPGNWRGTGGVGEHTGSLGWTGTRYYI